MPFRRKRSQRGSRAGKGQRGRDPFHHLADEREEAESTTWFLEPDDGPELDVQAGMSSNLSRDDLDDLDDQR